MVGAALIFSFDTDNVYRKFRYLPEEKIVFERQFSLQAKNK